MKHLIKIESTPHGVLGVRHKGLDQQYCEAGELVILEWQPDAKWGLQEAHYTDGDSNIVPIDLGNGNGVVAFMMPNKNITVGGTFRRFVIEDWKSSEATAGNLVSIDANENISDSGIAASDVATNEDLADKADKVSGATSGDFAGLDSDGNLTDSGSKAADFATAAQGAKADTAYQKPSTGIPESDLSSDVQQALQKHFKGWYDSSSNLPANPVVGDYAYVKGAESTDPAAIYECTTDGTWSDSGRTVDTSNVQTFASGEEVNEVHIVDDLTTGGVDDVLSAEQGYVLDGKVSQLDQGKVDYELNSIGDTPKLVINTDNNTIDAVIPNAASKQVDLDSIAYESLTYRQIFETSNILLISPGFEDGTYSPLEAISGVQSPTVIDTNADSGDYCLDCSGSGSHQVKKGSAINGTFYFGARVKCTAYTAGKLGFSCGATAVAINSVTTDNDYVTLSKKETFGTASTLILGSFSSANLTGYIDTPVVISDEIFTTPPTEQEFETLYNSYVDILKGNAPSILEDVTIPIVVAKQEFTPEQCESAFVAEMNKYAEQFGMSNTGFRDPHGIGGNYTPNLASAEDIMRLVWCCSADEKLMRLWWFENYSLNVTTALGGSKTINVVSTYRGSNMSEVGDYYHIFGGKTGSATVSGTFYGNLTLLVKSKVDDAWLMGCIIQTTATGNNKGIPMKQLLDWLEDYRINHSTPTPTLDCGYAAAGVVPQHNPMAYADIANSYALVGKDKNTAKPIASMTKLMTAKVALDYCDFGEIVTIDKIMPGSGPTTFAVGDSLRFDEAIIGMLLPSSNTLATAIARHVGKKILMME